MNRERVLVVGAGIAGLAFARTLDTKRYDVVLIDKSPRIAHVGYALILMASGVAALRELGVSASGIRALGSVLKRMCSYDAEGRVHIDRSYAAIEAVLGESMIVDRGRLMALLKREMKSRIRWKTDILSLRQVSGTVEVQFSDGKKEVFTAVIGADGAASAVRRLAKFKETQAPVGYQFGWCWGKRGKKRFQSTLTVLKGSATGVVFFDTGDEKRIGAALFLHKDGRPGKEFGKQTLKRLSHELAYWKDEFRLDLRAMHVHRDREIRVEKPCDGKVCLIGDAAGGRSVFTGMGAGIALESAVFLGKLMNTTSVDAAFGQYSALQTKRLRIFDFANLSSEKKEFGAHLKFARSSPLLKTR